MVMTEKEFEQALYHPTTPHEFFVTVLNLSKPFNKLELVQLYYQSDADLECLSADITRIFQNPETTFIYRDAFLKDLGFMLEVLESDSELHDIFNEANALLSEISYRLDALVREHGKKGAVVLVSISFDFPATMIIELRRL